MASTSSLPASISAQVLPGQPLPSGPPSAVPSSGVYQRGSSLLSSLIGQPSYVKPSKKAGAPPLAKVNTPLKPLHSLPEPDAVVLARVTKVSPRQAVCSILLVLPDSTSTDPAAAAAPAPLNLSQALASGASNHAAGEDPAGLDFSGVIRQQDVRLTETDKVRMGECFRPGDLVRARVVSLGDARSYYLTTASNELGVVFASRAMEPEVLPGAAPGRALLPSRLRTGRKEKEGEEGKGGIPGAMQPLSWQEVVDPATGKREKRKVAKPEGI